MNFPHIRGVLHQNTGICLKYELTEYVLKTNKQKHPPYDSYLVLYALLPSWGLATNPWSPCISWVVCSY